MNHSWTDRRVVDGVISVEYKSVKSFCDYAFGNAALLVEGWVHCLCKRCVNKKILDRDTIIIYLYRSRFMPNYKYWYLHGEIWETIARVRSHQQDRDTGKW